MFVISLKRSKVKHRPYCFVYSNLTYKKKMTISNDIENRNEHYFHLCYSLLQYKYYDNRGLENVISTRRLTNSLF